MDLLRVPPALRRVLLNNVHIRRCISTHTHHHTADDTSLPPTALPRQTSSNDASTGLLSLSTTTLNSYTTGAPPNVPQLKYAASFFHCVPPSILFSAAHFRSFPPSPFPEVAFLGRSNVGKSSLLNALFGRSNIKDAHVSKQPGRTRTMNGFGVTGGLELSARGEKGEKQERWKQFPRGGLVVVDMPGYGAGSREDWGKEIMKYLENRKQLRRTFVLVDAEHGLKATDISLLTHLRRRGISHQIVLSKVDKIIDSASPKKHMSAQRMHNRLHALQGLTGAVRQRLDEEAGDGRKGNADILCCSAEKGVNGSHQKIGVDEIRWAVLTACGMESDDAGVKRRALKDDIQLLSND